MTSSEEIDWKKFWQLSAEHANEAVRTGKILPDGTLRLDKSQEKDIRDLTFENTHRRYILGYQKMQEEMDKHKTKRENLTLYRTFFNDIYCAIEDGETVQNYTPISCFEKAYDNSYGDFSMEIQVPAGTNYLVLPENSSNEHGNTIIIPPGFLKLVERNDVGYIFKYLGSTKIFNH